MNDEINNNNNSDPEERVTFLEIENEDGEKLKSNSENLTEIITKQIAQKYKAIPLNFEDDNLTVGMINNENEKNISKLKEITGHDLNAVKISREVFESLFNNLYSQKEENMPENIEVENSVTQNLTRISNIPGTPPRIYSLISSLLPMFIGIAIILLTVRLRLPPIALIILGIIAFLLYYQRFNNRS